MKIILGKTTIYKQVKLLYPKEVKEGYTYTSDRDFMQYKISNCFIYDVSDVNAITVVIPKKTNTGNYTIWAAFRGDTIQSTYKDTAFESKTFNIDVSTCDTFVLNIFDTGVKDYVIKIAEGDAYKIVEGASEIGAYRNDGSKYESTAFNTITCDVSQYTVVDIVANGADTNSFPMWIGKKNGEIISTGNYGEVMGSSQTTTRKTLNVSEFDTLIVNSLKYAPPTVLVKL